MYSTYNEGKPAVAEIFIRTLKNKIFKHIAAISKKLVTTLEFQNIKTFLLRDIPQIGQKNFFLLVKLKIQFPGLTLLVT